MSSEEDDTPLPAIEQEDRPLLSLARRKRNHLLFLLVWAIVSGGLYGAMSIDWGTPLLFLDMVVYVIVVIRWTYLDAAEHDFRLWRFFVPLMVLCPGPLLVMPVYFIKSRGWRRGLAACGLALAFSLVQFGIDCVSTYVAIQLVWGD